MTPRAPTLEDTLSSQADLARLCADRPLQTGEAFAPNAYYGNGHVLKAYAGLPQRYALKAVIPHGIVFSPDYLWEAEATAAVPAVLCYTPHREAVYRTGASKTVVPSASPFLYLLEMLKAHPATPRRGTIFFPHHSTHHVASTTDFQALAERLTHLAAEYQPVTVCIYWRDYNLGHHVPFEKRGLPIVSAGHMYDPAFLFRFRHLCSMHRYSAANGLGSNLFYSVKAGCSFFFLDTPPHATIAAPDVLRRDVSPVSPEREVALRTLFAAPQSATTSDQMKAVDYYLGASALRSPSQLRRVLLGAELLDKLGFVIHNPGARRRPAVPCYWRRIAAAGAAGVRGALGKAIGSPRRPG